MVQKIDMNSFEEFAGIAEEARELLLKYSHHDKTFDDQRLGHCGLCAEFLHGIGDPLNSASLDLEEGKPETEINESFFRAVVKIAENPSQLSRYITPTDPSFEENTLEAIPRSIQDLKHWAKTYADLPPDEREQLENLLEQATIKFKPIQDYIEQRL